MEFDKSRVYSTVNAEELHVGDVVYVADTLAVLRELVEHDRTASQCKITHLYDDRDTYRFGTDTKVPNASYDTVFLLAYLVARGESRTE